MFALTKQITQQTNQTPIRNMRKSKSISSQINHISIAERHMSNQFQDMLESPSPLTSATTVDSSAQKVAHLPLEEIVNRKPLRAYYLKFLQASRCPEPLLFIERIELYCTLESDEERYKGASDILRSFVRNGAKHELNLSQELRTSVVSEYDTQLSKTNCCIHFFDRLLSQVMIELKEDTYARFLRSEYYLECLSLSNTSNPASPMTPSSSLTIDVISARAASTLTPSPDSPTLDAMSSTEQENGLDVSTPVFVAAEVQKIKDWGLSETKICNTVWQLKTKKKEAVVYISKRPVVMNKRSRAMKMWKLIGELSYPVDLVFRAAISSDLRIKNDGNLCDVKPIDFICSPDSPYATSLTLEEFRFIGLANRRFIFCATICEERMSNNWKRIIIARKCLSEHEAVAPSKSLITGECTGGYVFEQANDENTKTKYYEIGTVDIKGVLPSWLLNLGVSSRGTQFHDGLKKSVEEYMKQPRIDDVRYLDLLEHSKKFVQKSMQ